MQIKLIIAVIGATGNVATAICKNLAAGNYKLLLFTNEFNQTQLLMQQIIAANPAADVEAIGCSVNASWEADIIIIDIDHHTQIDVVKKIKEVANQKIVISITNPLVDTNTRLLLNADIGIANEMQLLLPNSKVINVFNTSVATSISSQTTMGKKISTQIAGDDKEALQTVVELLSIAGFNPLII